MDLSRIYTKTSRGILDGNLKTRALGREHGRLLALIDGKSTIRDLLVNSARLSENSLAAILDELVAAGFIRLLSANTDADGLGFSSTIIVDEANTQAFFEAQAAIEGKMRRTEDQENIAKDQEREALLKEVAADIAAEAEVLKRQEEQRQEQVVADQVAQRAQKASAAKKAQAEAQERKAEQEARQRAQTQARALAEEKDRLAKEEAAIARQALEAKIQAEEEAQRRAEMESRLQAMEQAKNHAQKEVQTLSKALDEARVAAELENRVKRRLEARAREEAEALARLETERKAAAEAQARAVEEARRQAEAEAEAKLAAEHKARIEAEQKAQKEAEARAKAEAEARAAEEARRQAEAEARLAAERKARIAAEQKAQEEAEARAKAEAEAQALLEAQQKAAAEAEARAEEEARRQAEAEARLAAERTARIEAEQKAQEEAETRARAEAEAQALLEAEQKAAAEAQARAAEEACRQAAEEARLQAEAETQARAKAEAEAQALLEAQQKAAAEAEARAEEARRQAEAEAKLAAERKARIEAEEIARAAAAAQAVAAAEEAVRLEAEAVKRQMEQEQRAEEARRINEAAAAAMEAEHQARIVAESTAQNLAAERAHMEQAAKSREQDRLRAREQANAKALAEMEEARRRVEEEKQREEHEETRLRGEAEARALAAAETATLPFLTRPKRKPFRFDKRWYKPIAIAAVALLCVGIGMAHVVSLKFYIPTLQRQIMLSLGQRVAIQDLHFSLYPAPHLELDAVEIGEGAAAIRIAKANLFPSFTSWFSDGKVMREVELESLAVTKKGILSLAVWGQNQTRTVPIQFEHLLVKNSKFTHPLWDVFAFDADVDARRGQFIQAQVKSTDRRVTINFLPQGKDLRIELNAVKSVLPFEPRLPFDILKIVAVTQAESLKLNSIDAQMFDGYLSGTARVNWSKGWTLNADLGLVQVAVEPALARFTKEAKLTGTLEAKVRIAAQAEALESLFAAPQIQATFRAKNGEFSGIDLVRSIQAQSRGGKISGKTHFNDLSGYFQYAKGRYQYRQIKLQGGVVSAFGGLEVSPERNLSGNLSADLQTRSSKQHMPFVFTGNLAEPGLKLAIPAQRAVPAPKVPVEEVQ